MDLRQAQQQQRLIRRLKRKPQLDLEHLKQLKPLKQLEVEQRLLKPRQPRQRLIPLGQQVRPRVLQVQAPLLLVQLTMVTVIQVTKTLLYTILNKILCLYHK